MIWQRLSLKGIILHYQPIYDIEINRLIGVEALLRWDHRKKALFPGRVHTSS